MTTFPSFIEQSDPPRSAEETLPTMYDLPSEFPEEPGLPDEFHFLQPSLLSATFRLSAYAQDQIFTAGDLNIYYDVHHPLWHKRPDWFAALGVPRLYKQKDMRLSYVIWQEGVSPSIVVELLSPGTEREDLGQTQTQNQPPSKWHVYEHILRIPYYVVFNRYTDELQVFTLVSGVYRPVPPTNNRVWLSSLGIGIGLWQGTYEGITRRWLRWYDDEQNWILTPTEAAQQELAKERAAKEAERAAKEAAEQRAEQLAERLRELGVELD